MSVESKSLTHTFVDVDWVCWHKWSDGKGLFDHRANMPTVWIVLSGTLKTIVGDRSWQIEAGQVCWLPASLHRNVVAVGETEWLSTGLRIFGLPRLSGILAKTDPVCWSPTLDEWTLMHNWIWQAFKVASSHIPQAYSPDPAVSKHYPRELLAKLDTGALLTINGLGSAILGTAIPMISHHLQPLPEWLEKIVLQMEESPCTPVKEWAKNAGYSISQFRYLFQSYLKISPRRHKQECIFKRACFLIKTTDLPLSAIADDLHFGTVASFCRFFKQISGSTPTEFRESICLPC
jgi:AraC-like DNA-binding protein